MTKIGQRIVGVIKIKLDKNFRTRRPHQSTGLSNNEPGRISIEPSHIPFQMELWINHEYCMHKYAFCILHMNHDCRFVKPKPLREREKVKLDGFMDFRWKIIPYLLGNQTALAENVTLSFHPFVYTWYCIEEKYHSSIYSAWLHLVAYSEDISNQRIAACGNLKFPRNSPRKVRPFCAWEEIFFFFFFNISLNGTRLSWLLWRPTSNVLSSKRNVQLHIRIEPWPEKKAPTLRTET